MYKVSGTKMMIETANPIASEAIKTVNTVVNIKSSPLT
nr:MAG TPA: hypothetical protein [Caudoviricetes sp.]